MKSARVRNEYEPLLLANPWNSRNCTSLFRKGIESHPISFTRMNRRREHLLKSFKRKSQKKIRRLDESIPQVRSQIHNSINSIAPLPSIQPREQPTLYFNKSRYGEINHKNVG